MPRAVCRCGQDLPIPSDPSERVTCPSCGAKVRIRVKGPSSSALEATQFSPDGFLRFFCPCGRRLKVDAIDPPSHGQCPDCKTVVPVPKTDLAPNRPSGHPEAPTEELSAVDRAMLDRWAADHRARSGGGAAIAAPPPPVRDEVGLRVCPRCGLPVHLGAEACRACGTPVPRK